MATIATIERDLTRIMVRIYDRAMKPGQATEVILSCAETYADLIDTYLSLKTYLPLKTIEDEEKGGDINASK